jgi:hypothetical protein
VAWQGSAGPDTKLIVTYGIEDERIKEAFCAGFRAGTDICALANDACVMMSLLLQHGVSIEALADACGEDRQEGATTGKPSSLLGAITREGVRIERAIQSGDDINAASNVIEISGRELHGPQ